MVNGSGVDGTALRDNSPPGPASGNLTGEDLERRFANDRETAKLTAEAALREAVNCGYIEVAKASLDRAVQRGTFMTTVVSTIATAYAALLGLVYGTGDTKVPLPTRGVWAFVFLGISLILASLYVAFLASEGEPKPQAGGQPQLLPTGIDGDIAETRLKTLLHWTLEPLRRRALFLRLSVLSLAFGVATLPLPFLTLGYGAAIIYIVGGVLALALTAVIERKFYGR